MNLGRSSGGTLGLHLTPEIERGLECYQEQLELLQQQIREAKPA